MLIYFYRSFVGARLFIFRKESFHSRPKIWSEDFAPIRRRDSAEFTEPRRSNDTPSSTESTFQNQSVCRRRRGSPRSFTRPTLRTSIRSIRQGCWTTTLTLRTTKRKILTDFTSSLFDVSSTTEVTLFLWPTIDLRQRLRRHRRQRRRAPRRRPSRRIQFTFKKLLF